MLKKQRLARFRRQKTWFLSSCRVVKILMRGEPYQYNGVNMIQPQNFFVKLNEHLNILKERKAKYADDAPLALLNQIEDHQKAISLTEQVMAGEITEREWLQGLQPLLLASNHWSGISLAALMVLSRYARDQGVELNHQLGPTAAETAGEVFSLVLDRVKAVDPRTARRYPDNPEGYEAPLGDVLAELVEANRDFAAQLKALLTRYETEVKEQQGIGDRATITSSGVVTQHNTQTAGERGVVGSSAGGHIITGSGNVIGDVSVADSTGVGIGAGPQVSVTEGISGESLNQLLALIYRHIEAKTDLLPQDKADLKAEVDEIKAEVGDKTDPATVNESFLARRLRNIERMAPDIIDTIATTAVNPVAGIKGVWDKIVAKAREIIAARQARG